MSDARCGTCHAPVGILTGLYLTPKPEVAITKPDDEWVLSINGHLVWSSTDSCSLRWQAEQITAVLDAAKCPDAAPPEPTEEMVEAMASVMWQRHHVLPWEKLQPERQLAERIAARRDLRTSLAVTAITKATERAG